MTPGGKEAKLSDAVECPTCPYPVYRISGRPQGKPEPYVVFYHPWDGCVVRWDVGEAWNLLRGTY